MGVLDAALQGIGGGIETGLSWYDKMKGRQFEEKRLAQQADIASGNNMRAMILQELKNSGLIQQIGARGDQQVRVEGVKGENAQGLEDTRQGGRLELADVNNDAADVRNERDNTTRTLGITTTADTARRGQDVSATTQRRGQDIGATTQRRGQDLGFQSNTFATDSANRRALVPRPNTAMPFGGVNLPDLSYEKYFQAPPDNPEPDPTQPISAQPQIKSNTAPGPSVAPVPPPRPTAPQAAAPIPGPALQSPAGADRQTPAAGQYRAGQTVKLRNGQTVTIKRINPNGTFEY